MYDFLEDLEHITYVIIKAAHLKKSDARKRFMGAKLYFLPFK